MEEDSKSLRSLTFSGKKEHFVMWQAKFLSYAHFKNFSKVITGTSKLIIKDPLTKEEDESNTTFKLQNAQAYSTLNLCVKDNVSFLAIFNARTEHLPDGDAYKAWCNLQDIFKPVSSAKKHELEQMFNKSCLDKEQTNPDEWFAELERLRLQLKLDFQTEITDTQMISQIIYNTHPQPYKMAITILKRDLNRNLKLTLDNVKDDLRQIFASIRQTKRSAETALIGKPKFKKHLRVYADHAVKLDIRQLIVGLTRTININVLKTIMFIKTKHLMEKQQISVPQKTNIALTVREITIPLIIVGKRRQMMPRNRE
jgi:hypothetical protein